MQDAKRIPTIKNNTPLNSKNHIPGHPNYEPQRLFQPMSYRNIKRNELPNINNSNSHQAERLALRIYEITQMMILLDIQTTVLATSEPPDLSQPLSKVSKQGIKQTLLT